ncbi:H/ACA ribonucleoprotein complex subunit GAR1 [Natribaculum luteum]|uniref:H/ACA ribonucleoprotein complex subunit GAR1 n=1 Tax=Natribaculum luteum TaxID=1586232 RepID=A0ABD5NVV2_9EURY|nr:Gar1/Naf1 family protein [Natribaculum luteum]
MYRVGQVVRTAQGLAVVRSDDDDHADVGTIVLDDSLEEVGRVVDVFGPVDRPYLAVTPDDDVHLPGLVSSTLYAR